MSKDSELSTLSSLVEGIELFNVIINILNCLIASQISMTSMKNVIEWSSVLVDGS